MPLLKVKGLKAYYRQTEALHGVDFELDEGSITTILGANGAGKTTTLRAISRMVRTEGSISFRARKSRASRLKRSRGLASPMCRKGGARSCASRLRKTSSSALIPAKARSEVADDVERVYAYFPRLKERMKQQAGTLSGGEQQMLAIGRALMLRPKLMLLDEPSFGLAPLITQEIYEIMARIRKDEGRLHAAGRAEREYRA